MGSGIAQACAQAGFTVRVRDVNDAAIERGRGLMGKMLDGAIERKKLTPEGRERIVQRITFTTDVAAAVDGAALVIEAIFEDEGAKRELFGAIASRVHDETIVVSNTSSLSVARLSEGFPRPERFAGLHFFFPAQVNRLLEVIGGPATSEATLRELERFGYTIRKIPIRVKDSAGFAVNRYFVPYLNESARLADEGVAGLGTIEMVGRELFQATLGPFELMNVTGIPIAYHSERSLANSFGAAYAPSEGLRRQFESGTAWAWKGQPVEEDRKTAVRDRFLGLTLGIATRLVEEGVATAEDTDRGATVGLRWGRGPFALLSEVGLAEGLRLVDAYARQAPGAFPVSAELRARVSAGESSWPLRSVRTVRDGAVAWVLLDRPEVLNSLNSAVFSQLEEAFRSLDGDSAVRVVLLAGSSPTFAAGADIAEMASKSPEEGQAFSAAGQAACRAIERFRAPVIALVEGYALGGGLELAAAADFIVAAEDAQLGLPEATVGIHPGLGGASRLTRQIGPARTKLLLFTAAPVAAPEAARLGVVARVFPSATARDDALTLARQIAERAPIALELVKKVVRGAVDHPLDDAVAAEGESSARTFATADKSEGMRAFLERRPPKFTGA